MSAAHLRGLLAGRPLVHHTAQGEPRLVTEAPHTRLTPGPRPGHLGHD